MRDALHERWRGPVYEADLFSPEGIVYPHEHYRALRELGPAVYLPRQKVWAISRYADARRVLENPQRFISGQGVAVSDEMNAMLVGSIITSDGEVHRRIRQLEAAPLMPKSLQAVRQVVRTEADALVQRLKAQREFDAVQDLAQHLPVQIVANLVGLPAEGRENMLRWAASIFQLIGPLNETSQAAIADCGEMFEYVSRVEASRVKPGSWAARVFELRDSGVVSSQEAARMLVDLIGPALDSTIFGITNMVLLFGRHPEAWAQLRADRTLIANAVNEVLRLESPIRGFTRVASAEESFDEVRLPAGTRVLVLYASANRDDRFWTDADAFRIDRKNASMHLAFGYGSHSCLGMHLARLEMAVLLEALAEHVDHFTIDEPRMALITSLRGVEAMRMTLHCPEP